MRSDLQFYGELHMPSEAMEPILGRPVRTALLEWLTEIFAADELQELGVKPRKKAIFDGPPGVGKTTLAHHLAARLGLPMLAVRPEKLVSKYVGETGQNIGKLFDAAKLGLDPAKQGDSRTPVVLFIDEFDAIGMSRAGDTDQSADRNRMEYISVLLQRLEQHDGFVIAATNFGGKIDQAMWRRFDMHINLELPGQFEREEILKRYLAPMGLPRAALQLLGEAMQNASPALIRQFCEHLKRMMIIGPKLGHDMRREAVFERLTTTIQPHPQLGKPPMWATADSDHARDRAISALPWPLPKAKDLPREDVTPAPAPDGNVVPIGRRA